MFTSVLVYRICVGFGNSYYF